MTITEIKIPFENLTRQYLQIKEEIADAIGEVLPSGRYVMGPMLSKFEADFSAYCGTKYCAGISNGTEALHLSLLACEVGRGDEVITVPNTYIATVFAITYTGATPVFVDIDPVTYNIDPKRVEEAITPHTKAMMLVSINGRCPDMEKAQEICQRNNIHLIEDAAQSLGSRYKDKHLGTWGEIGSFSFSAPKVITTGQGGALVTDDPLLDARMRKVKDFGRRQPGEDYYESVGYNFKFTDLQAVVGIEQMKKLPWRVERKKEMLKLYQAQLEDVWAVSFPTTDTKEVCPWFIDIIVPDPNALKIYLESRGVGSRLVYPALHSQPAFNLPGSYPVAEYIAKYGLWLPSSSFLSDKDIYRVCSYIRYYYETMRW